MKTLLIVISSYLIIGNVYALSGTDIYKKASNGVLYLEVQKEVKYKGKKTFVTASQEVPLKKETSPEATIKEFQLSSFPFPKDLNIRMYSINGHVYKYMGESQNGDFKIELEYRKEAGTDSQFRDWKGVNSFVAREQDKVKNNKGAVTYPIIDSGVFHVKSTFTTKDGINVKYLRLFPGGDQRYDLVIHSKRSDFDQINHVVEKFMDKLRGNKAFSHLYKGKRNISAI